MENVQLSKCTCSRSPDTTWHECAKRNSRRNLGCNCISAIYYDSLLSRNIHKEKEPKVMHIYAFGSICRGDLSVDSDIDLLALVQGVDMRINPNKFSIYSYTRIRELWLLGNAFAWHLSLESKLVYGADNTDFLRTLGQPSKYTNVTKDCNRFRNIFEFSAQSIRDGTPSLVFELSTIFLAIRNIATCYSLAMLPQPTFGRHSAKKLGSKSIEVSEKFYSILERSRILSTRGSGADIDDIDQAAVIWELNNCRRWVKERCAEVGVR